MYDVNYFIQKFEVIPEERWITRQYKNHYGRCAMGHCMTDEQIVLAENMMPCKLVEANALRRILFLSIAMLNDGDDDDYQQPTPKKRILAALYDIRDLQQQDSAVNEVNKILEQKVKECDASKVLS